MKFLIFSASVALATLGCQNNSDSTTPKQADVQVKAEALSAKTGAATETPKKGTPPTDKKVSGDSKVAAAPTVSPKEHADPVQKAVATPTKESPLKGPVVEGDAFSVWLQSEGETASGKPASVRAILVAKEPYHCNAEYPHKFKYSEAPAELSYPKKTARGMKTTPKRGELVIPVQAEAAGNATLTGKLSFSVCTDERCLVEKQELSLALVVK